MKRKWIDLLLFYSTLVLIFSGIVLYVMPHGRIAYFTGWKFLGIDKDGWDDVHVIFGFFMSVVVLFHIIVNWRVMKKYLFQKESLFSLIIVIFLIAGSVFKIQPVKSVIDFEEFVKNSWEVNKRSVPIAHGELLSLKDFCSKLNINLNDAVKKLKRKGFKFDVNDSLKKIAQKNGVTPVEIYDIIKSSSVYGESGKGYGNMTFKKFCEKEKVDFNECIAKLKEKGIKFSKTETLRDIALSNGKSVLEIIKIIKE